MRESEVTALLAMQAIRKAVSEQTDKHRAGSLRRRFDEEALAEFECDHTRSKDLWIGDLKVGSYTVVQPKPKAVAPREEFAIISEDALLDWSDEGFMDYTRSWILDNIGVIAESYFYETGEMPNGCEIVSAETHEPSEPSPYVRISVDENAVFAAIGGADYLGGAVDGYLTGEVA